MPRLLTMLTSLVIGGLGFASAEQYVITTKFSSNQAAQFRITLNGQTLLMHRNADGNSDITPWVKPGKNTLEVEVTPGQNQNQFAKSVLTLGAGGNDKWRTLYTKEVSKNTTTGKSTFVFMAQPSKTSKTGKVSLFGKFSDNQPVSFQVLLNGEEISTMDSDGNVDVTPLLKKGKNVLTVKYTPGKNKNQFSFSTLTVGQQVGKTWSSLLKVGIGKVDTKSGSVTFPLYR